MSFADLFFPMMKYVNESHCSQCPAYKLICLYGWLITVLLFLDKNQAASTILTRCICIDVCIYVYICVYVYIFIFMYVYIECIIYTKYQSINIFDPSSLEMRPGPIGASGHFL